MAFGKTENVVFCFSTKYDIILGASVGALRIFLILFIFWGAKRRFRSREPFGFSPLFTNKKARKGLFRLVHPSGLEPEPKASEAFMVSNSTTGA